MYRLQLAMVQTNPAGQHPPLPLQLLVSADADTMQQLLMLQAMPWCGGFYFMPYDAGPQVAPQGVPAATEQQKYQEAPSSAAGQSRNQRKRFRKAEPTHCNQYDESPGTMAEDRSTGVDTGHAWIGTNNADDARIGKVWRTPTKNPLVVDHNLT